MYTVCFGNVGGAWTRVAFRTKLEADTLYRGVRTAGYDIVLVTAMDELGDVSLVTCWQGEE